jgi:hypothetical protein
MIDYMVLVPDNNLYFEKYFSLKTEPEYKRILPVAGEFFLFQIGLGYDPRLIINSKLFRYLFNAYGFYNSIAPSPPPVVKGFKTPGRCEWQRHI